MSADSDRERLKDEIRRAFATVERPGSWALSGTREGTEGDEAAKGFADAADWRDLDAAFLNRVEQSLSPLCFLSDEGFRYFLPAYLLTDVEGTLEEPDPAWHLTSSFERSRREKPVNARRFGARTWLDEGRHRFATFQPAEVKAIVAYLEWKREQVDPIDRQRIDDALDA